MNYLQYIREHRLRVTKYRLSAALGYTPHGYAALERRRSPKLSIHDLLRLKHLSDLTWQELGQIVERCHSIATPKPLDNSNVIVENLAFDTTSDQPLTDHADKT